MPLDLRPTAVQAIEVLKIHQLRRENTVIFNEIQTLRSEILALRDQSSEVQKAVVTADTELRQAHQRSADIEWSVKEISAATATCANDITTLRGDLQSHKTSIAERLQSIASRQTEFDAQLAISVAKIDQHSTNHGIEFERLEHTINELSDKLHTGRSTGPIHRARSPVSHCESAEVTQSQVAPHDSITKISETNDSMIETRGVKDPLDADVTRDLGAMLRQSSHIPVDLSNGDDMMLTTGQQDKSMPSAQCEQAVPLIHGGSAAVKMHGTDFANLGTGGADCKNPQSPTRNASARSVNPTETLKLPYPYEILVEILNLRQLRGECVVDYLNRSISLLQRLSEHREATRICLKRFVSGLPDLHVATYTSAWLDTSNWRLEDLKECFVLLSALLPSVTTTAGLSHSLPSGRKPGFRRVSSLQASSAHRTPRSVTSPISLLESESPNPCVRTDQNTTNRHQAQTPPAQHTIGKDDRSAVLSAPASASSPKPQRCGRRESAGSKIRLPVSKRHCKCRGERHLTENHRRALSRSTKCTERPRHVSSSVQPQLQTPEKQPCVSEAPARMRELLKQWKTMDPEQFSIRSSPPFTSAQRARSASSPEPEQSSPSKRIRLSQTKIPKLMPTKHRYNLRARGPVEQDVELPASVRDMFQRPRTDYGAEHGSSERAREDQRQESSPIPIPILQISTSDGR